MLQNILIASNDMFPIFLIDIIKILILQNTSLRIY